MTDQDEEILQITPYGLLTLEMDAQEARAAIDCLELYCRRHNKGIAVDLDGAFRFVQLAPMVQPTLQP